MKKKEDKNQTEEIIIKKKTVQETKRIKVPIKKEELIVTERNQVKNKKGETEWEEKTPTIPLKEEKVDVEVTPVEKEYIVVEKRETE